MDIYPCWRTIYRNKHSSSNIFRTEWGIWLQNRFTNVNGAQEIYYQLQEYVDEIWGLAEILNNRFDYRSLQIQPLEFPQAKGSTILLDEFYILKYTIFMNKLLKIFCFCGLFCLCDCCKNSIHPNLINKKDCKQILVKNYFDDNEYIINNDISIQELYELLRNATLCDIIKLPPRLVLTIKGRNYHQTFFICDNYIKDDKRKIYRCKKNIEKELKKIIKE